METASSNSTATPQAKETKRNPWLWIPSLYFAQGIPYVVVMTMSVIMYKRLGISNTDIALYTSLLNWPWVIKPLWSPFVDILKTKRWWILTMQFLIAIGLGLAGISVQTQIFFTLSLALFWLMAFSSATHDIAADGFYMLGLSKHDQAWWVGIRSTFFRLAVIVGSGILVMFAGMMESKNGLAPLEVKVAAEADASVPTDFDPASITVSEQAGELRLVTYPESLSLAPVARPSDEVNPLIAQARSWNREKGFYPEEKAAEAKKEEGESAWTRNVSRPLGDFLKSTFPRKTGEKSAIAGNIGVIYFTLSKEPEPDKEVVVNFTYNDGDKSIRVIEGERFVFTSQNWNQPFMALVQLDSKLKTETSAVFQARAGNIPLAWSITLMTIAGLFLVFFVYHNFVLPRPASDVPTASGNNFVKEFFATFGSYFTKPGAITAILFILLYRFAEAQAIRMIHPFMLDPREIGGLGLTTGQVGMTYGVVGVICLTVGGILGGVSAARFGLKTMLIPMVCAINLPNVAFIYMAFAQPDSLAVINACIGVEQFGYGFGFTGFMLYMLSFADGKHKTAHYAICTGFMAMGMMIPGMWSGWLQELIGYKNFFVWVMIATVPGFLVTFMIKVDPQFGKKTAKE